MLSLQQNVSALGSIGESVGWCGRQRGTQDRRSLVLCAVCDGSQTHFHLFFIWLACVGRFM